MKAPGYKTGYALPSFNHVDITQHHQDKNLIKPEILPGLKNITHNEPNQRAILRQYRQSSGH